MLRETHVIDGIGIGEKELKERKYCFRIWNPIRGKLNIGDKLKGFIFDYFT